MGDIYVRKFEIRRDEKITTAGSCFAQHIANQLRKNNYEVLDVEPAPEQFSDEQAKRFGFKLYSARYGNIYTVRQMLQLAQESFGLRAPSEVSWEKDGRFFDALRPSVEPCGLASKELVLRHRKQHISFVKSLLCKTSLFIFTMGLTETWEHSGDGTVYPTAPGTIAGSYDPNIYRLKNLDYTENLEDFRMLRELLREKNPEIRFIITVSPVPLTATASGDHVLSATTYSKSVLRAVAGRLAAEYDDIDYFPSFEIVAGIQARSQFYENNLRNVAAAGVDVVMRSFFEQHAQIRMPAIAAEARNSTVDVGSQVADGQRIYCEDQLLEAFAR